MQAIRFVVLIKFYFLIIHKFSFISLFETFLQLLPFYLPRHLSMVSMEIVASVISILNQVMTHPQHLFLLYYYIFILSLSTIHKHIYQFLSLKCNLWRTSSWLNMVDIILSKDGSLGSPSLKHCLPSLLYTEP